MSVKTVVLNAAKMNFDGKLDFSVLSDEVTVYDDTTPEQLLERIEGADIIVTKEMPVSGELNLKKAAKAVREKSIEMIKAKELLPLTGYVHGGCSPVGMKKVFPTVIDQTAAGFDTILFSGGKIGFQVEVALEDLKKILRYELADVREQ